MSYDVMGSGSFDYDPIRYDGSRLVFRGPQIEFDNPYVAVLGGSETYGKFVEDPFTALMNDRLNLPVVNFGVMNGGPDVFCSDAAVLDHASNAAVTVVQITGAQNMSNRYYSVHPRRNDRFVKVSSLMSRVFGDVDFTEFHYTRHMLGHLQNLDPVRFELIEDELKSAWIARMKLLLSQIRTKVILLWCSDRAPEEPSSMTLKADPLFVDRPMINALMDHVYGYSEVVITAQDAQNTQGMIFSEMEVAAAQASIGPAAHKAVARALVPQVTDMLGQKDQ